MVCEPNEEEQVVSLAMLINCEFGEKAFAVEREV
jgi:hypothetical protein